MRLLFYLSVGLFLLSLALQNALGHINFITREEVSNTSGAPVLGESVVDLRRLFRVFLNDHGLVRLATLQSYEAPVWLDNLDVLDWKTDMEVVDRNYSKFSFYGWLSSAYSVDLEKDGQDELVVEIITGKTINTIVYKFVAGVLTRVPVSTEKPGPWGFYGVASRNSPEFKDLDGDGILEMLAYYRHFPPENSRTVEVYKFNGRSFELVRNYEEKMPEVYL